MVSDLATRYQEIKKQTGNAAFIAVSKFQPVEKMIELYRLGHRDFGENYVQELIEKSKIFQDQGLRDVRFHFIGHLQSNKVKLVLPHVCAIHSIDSLKLLREVSAWAVKFNIKIPCYFQINLHHEASKGGFTPEELSELQAEVKSNASGVIPTGLMIIPDPAFPAAQAFEDLAKLSLEVGSDLGPGLSMGMSDDFGIAIQKGSTAVRIGTALFGARP